MKKLIIVFMCFIVCGLLSGCVGYYKNYELIGDKITYINDTEIYIECTSSSVKKRKYIQDIQDNIKLRSLISDTQKSIVVHWYEIELNGKLEKYENLEKTFEYEYKEEYKEFYPSKMSLGKFDLKTKLRDKLTVRVNLTVIAGGKEETKTIERTFVVKITTITKIDEWFSV